MSIVVASKRFLSSFNRVVHFSIRDQIAAKSLVNHLITSPNDRIIIPFVDYPGPVTEEILSRNFKSLTVCEPDEDDRNRFETYVKQKFPDKRIKIFPDDLFDHSFKSSNDDAQKRCAEIVHLTQNDCDQSETTPNNCDKPVKFLVPLMKSRFETSFLKNLYYQVALRIGLCSSTLINYYFLVSERQYNYLDAAPSGNLSQYRSTTVLYNTIFNIHTLESFDLKNCFKINVRNIQGTSSSTKSSYKKVYMIWLEPRLEVINSLDARSLMEYRFLVSQVMHKRTSYLLASLEKWFEGCSYELREMGITRTTRSGDLNAQQYYDMFIHIKNRQDYSRSIFRLAATQAEENTMII